MLHSKQMSNTITVRLPDDLANWLENTARESRMPRGRIIREQLEKARQASEPAFMKLAGSVSGPRDLSTRKGFSRK